MTTTNIMHPLDILQPATDTDFIKRKAANLANGIESIDLDKRPAGCSPLDVLPPAIQKLVYQLEHAYKFPADFSLVSILYCVSVAIGNNYRVKVKKKWLEIAALYLCIVAPPGAMKTPVLSFFLSVLKKIDADRYKLYQDELKIYLANVKAATKENPFEGEEPQWKQILLSDFTNEALIKALFHNSRGLGIAVDELAGFFAQMNRYSKGADVQFFLSLFNGQNIVVNRKSSGSFPIESPFASIIGGIQPGVMKSVFTPDIWNNGLAYRFLYCYPAGLKKQIAGDEELEPGVYEAYASAIHFLLNIDNGSEPVCIDFDPEAKKELNRIMELQAEAVDQANEEGNELMAGIINKADYQLIRLSLIVQVLHDAVQGKLPTTISIQSVRAAADLTEYFMHQADRVIDLVSTGNKPAQQAQTDEHQQFYEALPEGEFKKSAAIKVALELRPTPEGKNADTHLSTVTKWVTRTLEDAAKYTKTSHGSYTKILSKN